MYYVYRIKSRAKDWKYTGYCSDLKKRFGEHSAGKEENFLKTGKGRERLKFLLANS